jgi:hypothetical protein
VSEQLTLRASAIKIGYLKSMLHMRHAITSERPDSAAMRFGRLVHLAVLEPQKRPHVWQGKQRKGKDYDAWLADVPAGAEVCTGDEWTRAQDAAASVLLNPWAAELLADTEREKKIRLDNSMLGPVSARIDAWTAGRLVELKTTGRVDLRSVTRLVANMAYHIQMGFYSWILQASNLDKSRLLPACHIIAVEQAAPYDVGIYTLSRFDVMAGMADAVKTGERFRACEAAGVFPGVQKQQEEIKLEEWAYKDSGVPSDMEVGDSDEL